MAAPVRVRFAPSPTGHLHIGNVRTAILNWLMAQHFGGNLVLRIEDTDVERSTDESEKRIYDDLRWLGIEWQEGPDVGGEFGPYRQRERLNTYAEYANRLMADGHAYHCYCTKEILVSMREAAAAAGRPPRYDGRCRNLTASQVEAFEKAGRKPAIRFRVPDTSFTFADLIKGEITFPAGDLGDFVIVRPEGMPTYNFAVVIDDGLMQISHVVRGDDHVSNTPKQLAIYEATGLQPPQFAHTPMILGEDRTRLSKRHGATSLDHYAARGYLPHAMINYLSLLSWSSESGDELLSLQRLVDEFDFGRMSRAAAIFDVSKLTWMNGQYIRQLSEDELTAACLPYLRKAGYPLPESEDVVVKIVASLQDSLEVLEDVIAKAEFYFADEIQPENSEAAAALSRESTEKVFWSFIRHAGTIELMTVDSFRKIMKTVGKETGVIGKELWMPVRVALSGMLRGPELPQIAEIYGKEKCVTLLKKWLVD